MMATPPMSKWPGSATGSPHPLALSATPTSSASAYDAFLAAIRTPFVAGAIGGSIAAIITCPLEVLKTRMQAVELKPTSASPAAASRAVPPRPSPVPAAATHALRTAAVATKATPVPAPTPAVTSVDLGSLRFSETLRVDRLMSAVFREEGLRGLYRGVGATVTAVTLARSVYFGTYDYAKRSAAAAGLHGSPGHLLGGFAAGCASATIGSPAWVVKTRIQIEHVDKSKAKELRYDTVRQAVRKIWRDEGPRGFFRGLTASYLAVGEGALQLMIYGRIKMWGRDGGAEPSHVELFGAAALAKFTATLVAYPADVLRTRLRDHHNWAHGAPIKYTGLSQAFKLIWAEEGVRGLYAGLGPHMIRTVPNAAILFAVVELLIDL